jgi:tRNA pseudouridine38-40 synthase
LPRDIAVRWARRVGDDFHARFGARARRYRYVIQNRPVRAALRGRFVTWERGPLDADAMQRAAQALIGERDFSAFRTLACQARSPMRNVREISVTRTGEEVVVEIEANAFLHHMVRNIVGSLLPIGRGERTCEWLGELLHGRDRSKAGPTAPASGLIFIGPRYPAQWDLPVEVTL